MNIGFLSELFRSMGFLRAGADGNIIANVNHRTGYLADLLELDGGDGEISVATDVDAIVVHNGVAGEAKAYRHRPKLIGELRAYFSANVTGGTPTKVTFDTETFLVTPPGFAYNDANKSFVSPNGTAFITGSVEILGRHGVVSTKKITGNLKSTHVIADRMAYGELYLPVTGMGGHIGLANAYGISPSTVMFDTEPVSLWIDHNDGTNARTISGDLVMQFWEAP